MFVPATVAFGNNHRWNIWGFCVLEASPRKQRKAWRPASGPGLGARPHRREPRIPLDAEGRAGPRLCPAGLSALGVTQPLQLNCQALKRLVSGGSEKFCASCDSRWWHTAVRMPTGSGFGLWPVTRRGAGPAPGDVSIPGAAWGRAAKTLPFFLFFPHHLPLLACRHRPASSCAQLTPSHPQGSQMLGLQPRFRASAPFQGFCPVSGSSVPRPATWLWDCPPPGSPTPGLPTITPRLRLGTASPAPAHEPPGPCS